MTSNQLFGRMPGKRVRDVRVYLQANSLTLELFDKYVTQHSAPNTHYRPDIVYTGVMQRSMRGGDPESTMDYLALRYGLDSHAKGCSYTGWRSWTVPTGIRG